TKAADGSWNGNAYVTARVLEAYALRKANLIIRAGDFKLDSSTVGDGGTVKGSVTVTNTGVVDTPSFDVGIYTADAASVPVALAHIFTVHAGSTETGQFTFPAKGFSGTVTLTAVADYAHVVDEFREDDNDATTTLTVTGKPDL